LNVVSKLLGHKNVNTTSICIYADTQHVEAAFNQFHQRQTAAVAPPPPPAKRRDRRLERKRRANLRALRRQRLVG
jgi:hypothetical protein